jgi:chromosome segregation ATPase
VPGCANASLPCCFLKSGSPPQVAMNVRGVFSGVVSRAAEVWQPACAPGALIEIAELNAKTAELRATAAQLADDIAAAQARFVNVTRDAATARAEEDTVSQRLESVRLRIAAAKRAQAKLLATRKAHAAAVARNTEVLEELTKEVAEATASRDDERGRMARLKAAVRQLEGDLKRAQSEADAAEGQKRELGAAASALSASVATLTASVAKAQAEARSTIAEARSARGALASARELAEDPVAAAALVEAEEAVTQQVFTQGKLNGELSGLATQIASQEKALEAAAASQAEATAALAAGNAKNADAQAAVNAAAGRLAAARSALDVLRQLVAAARDAAAAAKRGYAKLLGKRGALSDAIARYTADVAASDAKRALLAAKVSKLQDTAASLSKAKAGLETRVTAAQLKSTQLATRRSKGAAELAGARGVGNEVAQRLREIKSEAGVKGELATRLQAASSSVQRKVYAAMARIRAHKERAAAGPAARKGLQARNECGDGTTIDQLTGAECDLKALDASHIAAVDAVANGRGGPLLAAHEAALAAKASNSTGSAKPTARAAAPSPAAASKAKADAPEW